MEIEELKKIHADAVAVCDAAYADLNKLRDLRDILLDEKANLEAEKKGLAFKLVEGDVPAKKKAAEITGRLAALAADLEPLGPAIDEYLARAERAQDELVGPAKALTRAHIRLAAKEVLATSSQVDEAMKRFSLLLYNREAAIKALEGFTRGTDNDLFSRQLVEALQNLKGQYAVDRAIAAHAGLTQRLQIPETVPASDAANLSITDWQALRSIF